MAIVAFLVLASQTGAAPDTARESAYLTGQLLVAAPDMADPRFAKTVIFIVKHDAHGAMGLVLNRLLGSGPLADLMKGFHLNPKGVTGTIRVFYGGPVRPYFGFVLHSTDYVGKSTLVINDRVALTTDLEILRAISKGEGPRHSLFALGYAGWGPGQLDNEIDRGDWFVADADESILFGEEMETKWKRAMSASGIDL